jgi:KaiC/GvpD/RAD55 family RecA-like ATPase
MWVRELMEKSDVEIKIEELKRLRDNLDKAIKDAETRKKEVEAFLKGLVEIANTSSDKEKGVVAAKTISEVVSASNAGDIKRIDVSKKIVTGVTKVDDLLLGGIPITSNVVLFGPPFSAKEALANNFVVRSLKENIPIVIVSADRDLRQIKADIARTMGSDLASVDSYEDTGILRFIDMYSKSIQIQSPSKNAIVIDGITNISALLKSMETVEADILKTYPYYRLLFISLTAFIPQFEEKIFMRFTQQFTQKRRSNPSVSMYLLEEGLFDQKIYETISYVMDGTIEFRIANSKQYLRVSGLSNVRTREWIEVYQRNNSFDLGSFSLERVR